MSETSALGIPPSNPLEVLTPKRRVFVEAYVRLMNGAQAAAEAGYGEPHEQSAHQLLINIDVQRAVSYLFDRSIKERFAGRSMGLPELLERLTEMARTDISDFLLEDVERLSDGATRKVLKPVIDLDKARALGKMFLIKSIKPSQWGISVEFHDAQQALRLLARIKGFEAPQRTEVSGPAGGPIPLAAVGSYDLSRLNDAEVQTLRALLNKARGQQSPLVGSTGPGSPVTIEAGSNVPTGSDSKP